ncbi:MAG TPA: ATP-dependent DNA ligase, partial [Opitutaceae bacterium]|nr:ATP-dependent DNA ligase [Opitutaceae bacterium]
MPWDVHFDRGLWLPQLGWHLDASYPTDRSFVSHAHFDHISAHREILCSDGTAKLMRSRLPGMRTEHVLPFGHEEALTGDCSVTLFPAGHIFGSAQALLNHAEHGSLLYTGDFKLRHGLSAEPCAAPRADLLIMETTFARPQYVFPPTESVLAAIGAFCREAIADGETPVLYGYSLGKSQEVLRSLVGFGLPVMLHPQTWRLTKVYEELGISFPPHREFSGAEVAGHVVLCPPQVPGSSFLKKVPRSRTAVLTGWAMDPACKYRYQCDEAFPLSDHADYPDLLRFVELVKPAKVLTLHGFAAEFAATLRERGTEAWAIGEDNQLELGVSVSPGALPVGAPPTESEETAELVESVPESFARFAETGERIRAASAKTAKTAILGEYLASLPPAEAALATVYFTGRPFFQAEDRTLNAGWSLLSRAVLDVAGISTAEFRAAYKRFADSGEASELVLTGKVRSTGVVLPELATFFDRLATARGPAAKLEVLSAFLRTLGPSEAKYLIKVITGDLRIGLKEGLVEEAVAAVTGAPLASVREANMICGDMGAVMKAALDHTLDKIELRAFQPLQFMLASPEPTSEAILERLGSPVWLEEKYDGIRCQIHKKGARVEFYSRDLHRITGQFPDLARSAQALPGDFIADGELLAWKDGRALPFAELQKRLGRKGDDFFLGEEIPVSMSLYDILWRDGRVLMKEPLSVRRQELSSLFEGHPASFVLAPIQQATTALQIDAAFMASRRRGHEGLMAKDPASPYSPGRRGLAWLKLKKAFATLDVVVVAVEFGHGKRRDVLSDYTFSVRDVEHDRLVTVGKAYSGLTDVEIGILTRHFEENTIEEKGRRRTIVPNVILEIAFDSLQPSDR